MAGELDFDSIECAAARIAPRCAHCGITILGHGVLHGDHSHCGAHGARNAGAQATDRASA